MLGGLFVFICLFICIFYRVNQFLVAVILVVAFVLNFLFSVGSDDGFEENATKSWNWFWKAADKVCLQG